MEHITTATFWIALAKIIWVNILLSGDNAVVIALAARGLPPEQRGKAIFGGSAAAIVLRVMLTIFAVNLLQYPFLKLVGALLLFYIGVQLLVPEDEEDDGVKTADHLWAAVRTILLADLVMSVDNVIAVAAAADSGPPEARILLLIAGLGMSIPLIIFGSQLLLSVMERYPVIITLGAALLGFVAGEMLVTDHAVESFFRGAGRGSTTVIELAAALGVVLVGRWLAGRKNAARPAQEVSAPPAGAASTGTADTPARRWLAAVDGSEGSARALQHMLSLRRQFSRPEATELHLINVQRPVSGDVSSFVATQSIDEYHRERSKAAMTPARAALAAAGLQAREHQLVGPPGQTIADVAAQLGCDLIVMGTRGLGSHTGALLGSVAQSVLEHASVPVLLSK